MRASLVSAAAAALLALAVADDVAPAIFHGSWRGSISQGFGAASTADPNSLECITNAGVITAENVEVEITETSFSYSGSEPVTGTFGSKRYAMAATPATQSGWSEFQQSGGEGEGIILLRGADDVVTCHYASVDESGSKPILTIVTLGGAGFQWQDQCQASSYTAFSGSGSSATATCETDGTSKSPNKSAVVMRLEFLGSRASGAQTMGIGAAVAGVAALAAAAAL